MKNSIYARKLMILMAFILPLWITFGRFGFMGWLTVVYMTTLAPVLFLSMIAFYLVFKDNYDERVTAQFGDFGYWIFPSFYLSVFLHGFFVLDGVSNNVSSIAINMLKVINNFSVNSDTYSLSNILATVSITAAFIFFIMILSTIVVQATKNR